jgi:hypothetical protein
MNKTQFGKWWSGLVDKHTLTEEDTARIFEVLAKCPTLKFITPTTHTLLVGSYKIASGRRVRVIMAKVEGTPPMPISKARVLAQVYGKPTSKPNVFRTLCAACRNIITPQIEAFRASKELPAVCPLSGRVLRHWGEIHIDHAHPPFVSLVRAWLEEEGLTAEGVKVSGARNNKTLTSETLRRSWYDYHALKAVLQLSYKKANLSKGAS